jgi:phage tail-like protein
VRIVREMSVQPNAKVISPYRNFKFRLYFEGKSEPVAMVSKMTALKRTTEIVEWRQGGGESNTIRKLAGKSKYEPITFERGLSLDTDLEDWADLVNRWGGTDLAKKDNEFRKELRVEVLDLDGRVVLKYTMHKCWVSEFTAVPDLDANANTVAIQTLKIENECWEKDK